MARKTPQRYNPSLFLFLTLIILFCSACGGETATRPIPTPTAVKRIPTPTATTPHQKERVSRETFLTSPVVYVALGASDAVGVGAGTPENGYVPRIAAHLPTGSQTINLGVSGLLLEEALQDEVPRAIAARPQLVTIWLVTNDFIAQVPHEDYMSDLEALLEQLRTDTTAHVVLANLPDLTRLPVLADLTDDEKKTISTEIQQWNTRIAKITKHYQVELVDLFNQEEQLTEHPEYVSRDGFHPSATGHARLSEYFWEAIRPSEQVRG